MISISVWGSKVEGESELLSVQKAPHEESGIDLGLEIQCE